jgi:hypothetical protein
MSRNAKDWRGLVGRNRFRQIDGNPFQTSPNSGLNNQKTIPPLALKIRLSALLWWIEPHRHHALISARD